MKNVPLNCLRCKNREQSLLSCCSLDELEAVNSAKTCTIYKKGQAIFHEGHLPTGLFCVSEGIIKLTKMGSGGKEQILRLSHSGDFIGYRSLLADKFYQASAVAIEDAKVCLIPKSTFSQLVQKNLQLHEGLMKLLCNVIEESESKLTDIAYKPVRGRIAEALILLAKVFEGEISLTREDLASFVGTVKETAIRTLSEFKDEKLIEIEKRNIRITNLQGLVRISNLYD